MLHTSLRALFAVIVLSLPQTCRAGLISYGATLDSASENNPADTSKGTGFAEIDLNLAANTMHLSITYSGLTSGVTEAHIHSPTAMPFTLPAGVASTEPAFTGFSLGSTSGIFDATLDMTQAVNYSPEFIALNGGTTASAELALFDSFAAGTAYLNLHTSQYLGGEILGFFRPLAPVPEPSSIALCGIAGVVGLALARIGCRPPACDGREF